MVNARLCETSLILCDPETFSLFLIERMRDLSKLHAGTTLQALRHSKDFFVNKQIGTQPWESRLFGSNLSTGLTMWISHRKEIRELTFRALALRLSESLRSDEGLPLETSTPESIYGGQFTLSTQLIKPNYLVILPPTQHHRNLLPFLAWESRLRYSFVKKKIEEAV